MNPVLFESPYLENFALVEECRGKSILHPHTEQLPKLYQATQREFFAALPNRIVKTDYRADPYRKLLLFHAVGSFCEEKTAGAQTNCCYSIS